jgi:urease accessory protein
MESGLLHPLTGLDHVLAMTSVGLWASQKGGRALWVWPSAFVGVMLVGGALGMQGVALPMVEPMIAVSVLVLGLLIASATRLPLWAGAALVGLFALAHGNAHGLEAPETGAGLQYALGFAFSTVALHGIGIALGRASDQRRWTKIIRTSGVVAAGVGAMMFFV